MMDRKLPHRGLQLVASGIDLPDRRVKSTELDERLGLKPGTLEAMSGVHERRHVKGEFSSEMGARALRSALDRAGLKFQDLDALICTSGTPEQAIPCTAALIQRAMGEMESGVPAFDVNATCLSFVTGLDVAASLLTSGRYRRVALVSAEVASVGLNPAQHEAYALFGDGAAAFIVEATDREDPRGVFAARMETYSEGADHCMIPGGGSRVHPSRIGMAEMRHEHFLFHMNGRKVFRLCTERIQPFMKAFLESANLKIDDFDLIIPHQASGSALELMRRRLEIPESKYMNFLSHYGNMISASIPLGLHMAIEEKRVRSGDRVMLVGTSAGVSIGAVGLRI